MLLYPAERPAKLPGYTNQQADQATDSGRKTVVACKIHSCLLLPEMTRLTSIHVLPNSLSITIQNVMQILSEHMYSYRVTDSVVQNYGRHAVQAILDPEDPSPWILLPVHSVSSLSRCLSLSHELCALALFVVPDEDLPPLVAPSGPPFLICISIIASPDE